MRTYLARSYFFASRIQFISRVIGEAVQFCVDEEEPVGVDAVLSALRSLHAERVENRDLAFQPGISGPIHLPHPAFADRRGDS